MRVQISSIATCDNIYYQGKLRLKLYVVCVSGIQLVWSEKLNFTILFSGVKSLRLKFCLLGKHGIHTPIVYSVK